MARLEKFSKTRGVASRIVFLIRDVMDMQRNAWVPRREKFTARKIEEIHAEAETELGIQIKRTLLCPCVFSGGVMCSSASNKAIGSQGGAGGRTGAVSNAKRLD